MNPWLLGAAALFLLRRSSTGTTSAPAATGPTAPGSIAADLGAALIAQPGALQRLSEAIARAPQAFSHTSADILRIAAALAANPTAEGDLRAAIGRDASVMRALVAELARNGAIAVAASAAVQLAAAASPPSPVAPPAAPPAAPPRSDVHGTWQPPPVQPSPPVQNGSGPYNAAGRQYPTPGAADPAEVHAAWDVLRTWPTPPSSGLAQWQRSLGVTPQDPPTIATFDRARAVLDAWAATRPA